MRPRKPKCLKHMSLLMPPKQQQLNSRTWFEFKAQPPSDLAKRFIKPKAPANALASPAQVSIFELMSTRLETRKRSFSSVKLLSTARTCIHLEVRPKMRSQLIVHCEFLTQGKNCSDREPTRDRLEAGIPFLHAGTKGCYLQLHRSGRQGNHEI